MAQVLYGDYNPSGKLPMTFPRNVGQVPIYYNFKNTGRPTPDAGETVFWSHYTDVEKTPLYPFGHGLSYASFEYSDLKLDRSSAKVDEEIEVTVSVTNTGAVLGKEVVQLYVHDRFASVSRPVRELKAFELVALEPGEKKEVHFTLDRSKLGFYNNQGEYIVEPGDFEVYVGGSSIADLMKTFTLK